MHTHSITTKHSKVSTPLLHASQNLKITEEAFASLRDMIRRISCQDPEWGKADRFTLLPKSADHLFRQFVVASDLLTTESFSKGGEILRQAFRDLEDVILHPSIRIYQTLLLEVPYCLSSQRLNRELKSYLLHVSRLLSIRKGDEPLTRISLMMQQLSVQSAMDIQQFIKTMYGIVTDCYTEMRGKDDFNTLKARVETLSLDASGRNETTCDSIMLSVERLLYESAFKIGRQSNEAMEIEFYLIFTTHQLQPLSEKFRSSCQRFISHLRGSQDQYFRNWSCRKLQLYGVAHWYLCQYFSRMDDLESSISCLRKSINATNQAMHLAETDTNRRILESNILQDRLFLEQLLATSALVAETTEALGTPSNLGCSIGIPCNVD